ncbi:Eukaryotic aspartyl protease family protein [Euphorbia peplus]|nr:Eukaryotic aspartyl protease family protein [Euphorbia peplus]
MDSIATTTMFLLFSLLIITTKALDPCDNSDLSIIPVYSKCSPFAFTRLKDDSLANTILHLASKDPQRLNYLSAQMTTSVPIAPGQQLLNIGNYLVRVKLGTPGQIMLMVLDTSNDASWVPCSGCTGCSTTTFSTNTSSTYGSLDCSMAQCTQARGFSCPAAGTSPSSCLFNQSYGGDSTFSASLVHDSITLGKDVLANFAFGCINSISGGSIPPQGLLGLGRGPLSLLSQTGSLYSGVFSYCLPSFRSYYFSGSLKLGPVGQPKSIRTTPLLRNPHRPSLYYVNLTGVSVGRVPVQIDPAVLSFDPNTGAGTIIDSGTVITRFVKPIYEAIRDEFRKQVTGPFTSLGAFDTCFGATKEAVAPAITLRFTGMNMVLPMENSLIHSSAGSTVCLAMAAVPSNVNSVLNVIANLQQQNHRFFFDVPNSRLGIARELCN